MRFLFFISAVILAFTLVSCGAHKDSSGNRIFRKNKRPILENHKAITSDTTRADVVYDTVRDYSLDGVPDHIDIEISKSIRLDDRPVLRNKTWTTKVKNAEIVDKADADSTSSKGTIAYSVPDEMTVGKQYKITVRISKEKGTEIKKTLVIGEREISISDENIKSTVTVENIRVEETMTVKLLSENGAFEISPTSTDKQVLEDESYTEWSWIVKPLKSGTNYLKMIITIKVESGKETSYKDIVVFDKNIKIKSNVPLEVKSWISEYWQWLMTTIFIPLIVFFYKKRNKDKNSE